jgi:hypothetical protein
MRYRIEYLEESTDEDSVCHSLLAARGDLDCARLEGWRGLGAATRHFHANGFQVREVGGERVIVAIETFDLPLVADFTLH